MFNPVFRFKDLDFIIHSISVNHRVIRYSIMTQGENPKFIRNNFSTGYVQDGAKIVTDVELRFDSIMFFQMAAHLNRSGSKLKH